MIRHSDTRGRHRVSLTPARLATIRELHRGGMVKMKDLNVAMGISKTITRAIVDAAYAMPIEIVPDILDKPIACETCGGRMMCVPCAECRLRSQSPQYVLAPAPDAERIEKYRHKWVPTSRTGGFDVWQPRLLSESALKKSDVAYHKWVADCVHLTRQPADAVIRFLGADK